MNAQEDDGNGTACGVGASAAARYRVVRAQTLAVAAPLGVRPETSHQPRQPAYFIDSVAQDLARLLGRSARRRRGHDPTPPSGSPTSASGSATRARVSRPR